MAGNWRSYLATGRPFEAEARVRGAVGTYHTFLHRRVPFRDEHGNMVKLFGSSIDIEDRRRVEEQPRGMPKSCKETESISPKGRALLMRVAGRSD